MMISSAAVALVDVMRERIAVVQARIDSAARSVGRAPGDITLVGVSKTVGREVVDAAYAAGLRDFGENRVQDARDKFTDAPLDLRLHLIGSLQTNKVRYVVGSTHLIHSVDRVALVDELQRRAATLEVVQPILLQINIAREEQKHGCEPEDTRALLEHAFGCPNLRVGGFMTMAPLVSTPEEARPVFAGLRDLRDELQRAYPEASLGDLSMGMTNDYDVAIQEGATLVRVGRAIFAETTAS
jgi:pyridoxal phosphate enzyme (YggS family)